MPAVRPERLPRTLPLPAAASLSENGTAILDSVRTGALGVAEVALRRAGLGSHARAVETHEPIARIGRVQQHHEDNRVTPRRPREAAPRMTMDSSGAAPERLRLAQTFVAGLPDDHKQRVAELERRLAAATEHEQRVRASMRIVLEPVRARDTARAERRGHPKRAGPSALPARALLADAT